MTLQLTKKHSFDIVFDSQKVFRLILEAMSNPSRVVNIQEHADKLFGNCTGFLAVAMALLDNETSFSVIGNESLSDEIASLTLSRREETESADFIFVYDTASPADVIEKAKCGTLPDPHKSATVVFRNSGDPVCRLMLHGSGIDGHEEIVATQTVKDAIACRDLQGYEYPQGIDLIFISEAGDMFAIPRLVQLSELKLPGVDALSLRDFIHLGTA